MRRIIEHVGDKQRGTWSRGTNLRFPFDVRVMPNLSSTLSDREWLRDPKKYPKNFQGEHVPRPP